METAHLPNGTLLQGGRYKIVRFIGSGGFGCTYEGEHTMLGKKVAVKEFFVKDFCDRDETSSHVTSGTIGKRELVEKLRGKFVEEARATSLMQHPNIIKVSDVFEENETAYYVMDYIEGPSLDKIVKEQGPLPEQTAVKYIRQVADALAYVHSLNRLHLDLKPANIMTDGHGNAILVDFGASKQYDEAGGENTSTLIGKTPGYAPIEQMGNTVTTFTPATDIYALGATLYKLLTGTTPLEATMLASGEELAPLPSNISESTANAVYAAMQVAKSKRPRSIAEFLSLLEEPAGKPSTGVGTSTTPTSPAPVAPNPVEDETIIDSVPKKGEPQHSSQPQPNPEPDPSDKPKSKKGWRIAAMIVSAVIVIAGIVLFFALRTPTIKMVSVTGQFNGQDYVDLGLSVKWATCNVGAQSPSDYGNYYAWGEITTKSEYTRDNSVTYGKAIGDIAGNPQYDAATANWGGGWRLPTKDETNELRTKCKWKWGKMDGHKGFKVTGPSGNSIFLPAAGRRDGAYLYYSGVAGYYLRDEQLKKEKDDKGYFVLDAEALLSGSGSYKKGFSWDYGRDLGQSVRPVLGKTSTTSTTSPTSTQTSSSSSATNGTSSSTSSSGSATTQQGSNQTITQTSSSSSTATKPSNSTLSGGSSTYYPPTEITDMGNTSLSTTSTSSKPSSSATLAAPATTATTANPATPAATTTQQTSTPTDVDKETEAIPFMLVEVKPSFMGGDASSFTTWVNQHLVYPEIAKNNGVQGRVTLQFTVGADGTVGNVIVLRGVDSSLDNEAVRVVSMSPKWTPGEHEGRAVAVTYTFPVVFQLR